MKKNVASQKVRVYAFDSTTSLPKTGDAANLTAYISKDFGAITALTDTSATEEDSTNAKGYYLFDITQSETNADDILITCKSSTANIVVVGSPARITTVPQYFGDQVIDSSGRVDVSKVAGTSQTARDLGANLDTTVSSRSTLTQTQVTGGAYSIQSASCVLGDARIANLDAAVTTRMATYTQPTGFLAATFPGTVASTTNITAASGVTLTSAYDFAKGTVAMTESYATDGAAMTPVQALHQIWSLNAEKSMSGYTLTTKKLDGSTTAMTLTVGVDSRNRPVTMTRAT